MLLRSLPQRRIAEEDGLKMHSVAKNNQGRSSGQRQVVSLQLVKLRAKLEKTSL